MSTFLNEFSELVCEWYLVEAMYNGKVENLLTTLLSIAESWNGGNASSNGNKTRLKSLSAFKTTREKWQAWHTRNLTKPREILTFLEILTISDNSFDNP